MIPVSLKVLQHARVALVPAQMRLELERVYDWHPAAPDSFWQGMARDIAEAGRNSLRGAHWFSLAAYNASVHDFENAARARITIYNARAISDGIKAAVAKQMQLDRAGNAANQGSTSAEAASNRELELGTAQFLLEHELISLAHHLKQGIEPGIMDGMP